MGLDGSISSLPTPPCSSAEHFSAANMQAPPKNPDTRPLPEGWAEHFDSQRRLWYYIDLDAASPRVTFVHPCDANANGTHPASAPAPPTTTSTARREHSRLFVRPTGSRENTTTSAVTRDRTRRATVAQQLYASSLTQESRNPSPASSIRGPISSPRAPSLRRPSVSSTHTSDEVASNSLGASSTSTANPLTHLDSHDPRNFFDYTRLSRGTRRSTFTGPQPGGYASSSTSPHITSSASNLYVKKPTPSIHSVGNGTIRSNSQDDGTGYGSANAQAFYHPSAVLSPPANTTASATAKPSSYLEPRNQGHRPTALPLSSNGISPAQKKSNNRHWSMLPGPLPPTVHEQYASSSKYTPPLDNGLYTAVTEDNMMVMPTNRPGLQTSAHLAAAGTTEDNLMVMPTTRSGTSIRSKRASAIRPIDVASFDEADYSYPSSSAALQKTTKAMRRNTVASPLATEQPILQPRPIKPINAVSLNLQVQVTTEEEPEPSPPDSSKTSKKDKRNSSMRFGLGLGKGSGSGGGLSLFGIHRGPRDSSSSSRDVDRLASRMDESFLMVDNH